MTAFTTSSITLLDEGVSTNYTTTGTTTYFEDSTAGVYADLAMGENVNLDLTSTTTPTVTKVTIRLEHVFGTVTGVVGNVITITGWHSDITTVDVSATTTYTSGGAASTLGAVVMGAKISAVGLPGTTAGTLNANAVNIWAPRLKTHADGTVTAFTTTSITLLDEGVSTIYTTAGTTTYFEGSTAGVYADLAMGENVKLDLTSTTPQTVTKVTICLVHVFGTVTGVAGNVITITAFHSTITTVDVSGTTTYTSGGAASSLAAVVMGAKISAVGLPGTTAGTLNANAVNIWVAHTHGDDHGNNQGSGHGHGKSFGHHSHIFVSMS